MKYYYEATHHIPYEKINSLRLDMDEMAKEVKAIENFRKLAAQNEKFRELFQAYEHLIKNDDYTASAG